MKKWTIDHIDEALKDYKDFDKSVLRQIDKIIERVSQNPLPQNEGGYGKPLGNKGGKDLTGYCKIKLLKLGIRVVYKLIREGDVMKIIVIAARADDEVYDIAYERIAKK
jgi:mRNA interferase RelE/StbE